MCDQSGVDFKPDDMEVSKDNFLSIPIILMTIAEHSSHKQRHGSEKA